MLREKNVLGRLALTSRNKKILGIIAWNFKKLEKNVDFDRMPYVKPSLIVEIGIDSVVKTRLA